MIQWESKNWGKVAHLFDDKVGTSTLEVIPGECTSIHYHKDRWNVFHSIDAIIDLVMYYIDSKDKFQECVRQRIHGGGCYVVPPGSWHRFEVVGPGRLVEIYYTTNGHPVDMNDIVRHNTGGKTDGVEGS